MKRDILKIAKRLKAAINIETERQSFDIYNYIVRCNGKEELFQYYTGVTNTGVKYPFDKSHLLYRVEDFLISASGSTANQSTYL